MSRSPFPFIVGCGRSGTTLLRAIFDSHPEVAVPPEAHFVGRLLTRPSLYESPYGIKTDAVVAMLQRSSSRVKGWDLSASLLQSLLEGAPSLAEGLRRIYTLHAEREGKPRYGDKTPENVHIIDTISAVLPEARFIHIIRDGRDVTSSVIERVWGPQTVTAAAVWWRQAVRHGRRSGRRLGPEKYVEVRYEKLVAEPERTMRSLCSFGALDFSDEMLRYHERERPARGLGSGNPHSRLRLPPTPGLRDWRREMSGADLALFENLAGDLLDELGYERGADSSITASLRARAYQAAWVSRRAARKAGRLLGRVAYGAVVR